MKYLKFVVFLHLCIIVQQSDTHTKLYQLKTKVISFFYEHVFCFFFFESTFLNKFLKSFLSGLVESDKDYIVTLFSRYIQYFVYVILFRFYFVVHETLYIQQSKIYLFKNKNFYKHSLSLLVYNQSNFRKVFIQILKTFYKYLITVQQSICIFNNF